MEHNSVTTSKHSKLLKLDCTCVTSSVLCVLAQRCSTIRAAAKEGAASCRGQQPIASPPSKYFERAEDLYFENTLNEPRMSTVAVANRNQRQPMCSTAKRLAAGVGRVGVRSRHWLSLCSLHAVLAIAQQASPSDTEKSAAGCPLQSIQSHLQSLVPICIAVHNKTYSASPSVRL